MVLITNSSNGEGQKVYSDHDVSFAYVQGFPGTPVIRFAFTDEGDEVHRVEVPLRDIARMIAMHEEHLQLTHLSNMEAEQFAKIANAATGPKMAYCASQFPKAQTDKF